VLIICLLDEVEPQLLALETQPDALLVPVTLNPSPNINPVNITLPVPVKLIVFAGLLFPGFYPNGKTWGAF